VTRYAIVRGGATAEVVARYLPSNYQVVGTIEGGSVIIAGYDSAGWTLDDYVIPRLGSGLYSAIELEEKR
jgi:hypothetical protein